jgi:hypothetical protein
MMGDHTTNMIKIVVPVNIRYHLYQKLEDVRLENKFGPFIISLPLCNDMDQALI